VGAASNQTVICAAATDDEHDELLAPLAKESTQAVGRSVRAWLLVVLDLPTDPEDHFQVSKGGSGIRPAQLDDPLFQVKLGTTFMQMTTKMNLLRYQSTKMTK
jgi:hypothetical protein